jgi:hypothetical protein
MNCQRAQVAIGNSLFIGVESANWSLAQFGQAAQWASAHGIDTLIVKVFDGPNEWYGAIGGFAAIKKTIEARGVHAMPYGYMYGNASGSSLTAELAIVQKYMNTFGWCMADIESEWNGHTDWATTLNTTLKSNPNLFYASIMADPAEQNQLAVLPIMAPSVNAWMPQAYSAFLDQVYSKEMTGLTCIIPTVDLSNEFGSNSPLQYATAMGFPISLWEYQFAVANPSLVESIIKQVKKEQPSVPLSPTGEIADFCDADQFQPGKSAFECGFFAVAIVDAAAPVGQPCRKSVAQITSDAEAWYAQYNGDNSSANQWGMSVPQEQQLLTQVGLHWFQLPMSLPVIRAWVSAGYPVIIAGTEVGMYDIALGDKVPYPWIPSGNHIVTLTGNTSDGNFLVRDSANIDPQGNLRPGPRNYDASKFQFVSAHAVVLHGQAVPQVIGGVPVGVPTGWKDDGTTLTATNGIPVVHGFRNEVINSNWDAANVPLMAEAASNSVLLHNSSVGAGTYQLFQSSMLWWTQSKGVVNEGQLGSEIFAAYNKINSLNSQAEASAKQIADLQAQLAAAQAASGSGVPAALQAAVNQAEITLTQAADALKPFEK